MCRHVAYLGAPRTLYDLLYAAPYSLHTQSYAPREQRHGTVNADGFGAGWYDGRRSEPLRYRRAMPIWADSSFADVARAITATCAVAAVRDATPGFGTDESCAQPFRADTWLFSHNGAAKDDEALAARLGTPAPPGALDARTPVDSAPLFASALRLWRTGAGLGEALARVAAEARACSPGRYNLLASDGSRLAATADGDTLYARRGPHGVWLASEPLDDDAAWQAVPDGCLVTADRDGLHIGPIPAAA
ncbi:ergothioneine biosynthesis protein EgtC [Streptomonospora wellingtoniae]|uniref:Gamma-glutamyl-hercynylcysteine sulfoxide hydrolase n=1 Tax=Streptomonospora wellingtoniae TaxID=3075544 RepID=A0ABU2L013_9ACTN|nr:ergothioneine biosynthesis protein EgtC [Streptomonospora sp. DSM 45055]MDT0304863.1 ergothioneine biosynthesis protein EgtC [Streptomonospora sp. DSM 45055]